jgi:hypothetical protein
MSLTTRLLFFLSVGGCMHILQCCSNTLLARLIGVAVMLDSYLGCAQFKPELGIGCTE